MNSDSSCLHHPVLMCRAPVEHIQEAFQRSGGFALFCFFTAFVSGECESQSWDYTTYLYTHREPGTWQPVTGIQSKLTSAITPPLTPFPAFLPQGVWLPRPLHRRLQHEPLGEAETAGPIVECAGHPPPLRSAEGIFCLCVRDMGAN